MAVKMRALRAGRAFAPGRFLVLISVTDRIDPTIVDRVDPTIVDRVDPTIVDRVDPTIVVPWKN
jgi:hypothetical protein